MKKKILAFFLVLALMLAPLTPVRADDFTGPLEASPVTAEQLEESIKTINNAVKELEGLFTAEEASSFSAIFSSLRQSFATVGSIVTPINGAVTFLRLIGLLPDATKEGIANIQNQLLMIGEQLTDMDRKLNDLTAQMAAMQASAEFNTRTEKAILLRSNWKDFAYRYMEDSMDELMTQYNSMILNGMQAWCLNEGGARTANGVDNTALKVVYRADAKGEPVLRFSFEEPEAGDTVYLIGEALLPQKITWNINKYRDAIRDAVIANIKAAAADGTLDESLTGVAADAARLQSVAEDAVSVLVYRVAAAQVNKDSSFSLQVVRQFNNFCNHLLASEEGIDALSKAMFLTHAFEYEIAEDYTQFFNEMILKAGVYGAFVTDVLDVSAYVTDAEKSAELSSFVKLIDTLENAKQDGLTGNGDYCYITNSRLAFGEITFETKATIKTYTRGSIQGYEEATLKSTFSEIHYGNKYTANTGILIGDADAVLLQYMLRANGATPGFAYYNEHLAAGKSSDYGKTVVSLVGEKSLPLDNSTDLGVRNVIGNYFKNISSVRLSSLPGGADSDDIVARRMMQGSVTDNKTGALSVNTLLSAIALYGENHIYWEVDEAAFLGGPRTNPGFSTSYSKESAGVDVLSSRYFLHSYSQTLVYNALVKIPGALSAGTEDTPLSAYQELCEELEGERPEAEVEIMDDLTLKAPFFARYGMWIIIGGAAAAAAAVTAVCITHTKKKRGAKAGDK